MFDWNFSAKRTSSEPFSQTPVRTSTKLYLRFILGTPRSHGFGSAACNCFALFRLGFPAAPRRCRLALLHASNSLARSTKSTPSLFAPAACGRKVSGSVSLPSRGSFHLSLTVLCAIGHQVVFSLGRRPSHLQTGFHVPRPTLWQPLCSPFRLRGACPLRPAFPGCSAIVCSVFAAGLFPFRSPLLRESMFLSFPAGT